MLIIYISMLHVPSAESQMEECILFNQPEQAAIVFHVKQQATPQGAIRKGTLYEINLKTRRLKEIPLLDLKFVDKKKPTTLPRDEGF